MAKVGAQRAAELTGRSKSTIQRAMKYGKISFEMDHNGRRLIDVAELERAFGLMPQDAERKEQSSIEAELEKAAQMLETERLKMRIRMLEDQLDNSKDHISELKDQRDQWQKQAQQVLLTSQYSQKQAEELKEEMKERERRYRQRREQEMRRMQQQPARPTVNQNRPLGPLEKIRQETKNFDIQGLWHKIRGQETDTAAARAEPARPQAAAEPAAPAATRSADAA